MCTMTSVMADADDLMQAACEATANAVGCTAGRPTG